jgi:hypothetical protein
MLDASLQLKYVFTPSPNPIRASVGGANANKIDLTVMVSNPSPEPVQVETITIEIPMGEESARSLSANPDLPAPSYDTTLPWTITSSADTVTLTPASGRVVDYVIFTLEGIVVNDTPGVVPLTITETAPKVTDGKTYELVKREPDFPITNFYTTPQTLYDLEQTVTIYWECSEQGEQYAYSLHSDSWQPRNCLDGGDCYTCQDGQNGVQTPPLDQDTTFALYVIETDSSGGRTIYQTLYTPVQIKTPSVDNNSYLEQSTSGSGRLARLHWVAYNAAKCTILLEGEVLVDNAPTDTYLKGYTVLSSKERASNYGCSPSLFHLSCSG